MSLINDMLRDLEQPNRLPPRQRESLQRDLHGQVQAVRDQDLGQASARHWFFSAVLLVLLLGGAALAAGIYLLRLGGSEPVRVAGLNPALLEAALVAGPPAVVEGEAPAPEAAKSPAPASAGEQTSPEVNRPPEAVPTPSGEGSADVAGSAAPAATVKAVIPAQALPAEPPSPAPSPSSAASAAPDPLDRPGLQQGDQPESPTARAAGETAPAETASAEVPVSPQAEARSASRAPPPSAASPKGTGRVGAPSGAPAVIGSQTLAAGPVANRTDQAAVIEPRIQPRAEPGIEPRIELGADRLYAEAWPLLQRGDWAAALPLLRRALAQQPGHAPLDAAAQALRARLLARAGRHRQAIPSWQATLAAAPQVGENWAGFAHSLEAVGEIRAAALAWRRALGAGLPAELRNYAERQAEALASRLAASAAVEPTQDGAGDRTGDALP